MNTRVAFVRRNVLTIAAGTALGFLLARSPDAVHSAIDASPYAQTTSSALTLAPGDSRPLYVVSGFHYGVVGRFIVSCTRSGLAKTYYKRGQSPDGLLIVDGRGASRGANLAVLTKPFPGGVRQSGIERWVMSTGGEPESITLDASLRVISATRNSGFCFFGLQGKLVIQPH